MMDTPKVTVFTTVFNAEKWIEQAIESVLQQTFTEFEYIILLNGCTDQTPQLVRRYAERDGRIKVLSRKANNRAAEDEVIFPEINTPYITILDGDDWFEPTFLEKMYHAIEDEQCQLVLCSNYLYHENQKQREKDFFFPPLKNPENSVGEFVQNLQIYGSALGRQWSAMYVSELYCEVMYGVSSGELPEKYPGINTAADILITWTYLKACQKISIVPEHLITYRLHAGTVRQGRIGLDRIDEAVMLHTLQKDTVAHFGMLDEQRRQALFGLFYGHINMIVNLIAQSNEMSTKEKLGVLQYITQCEPFYEWSDPTILIKVLGEPYTQIMKQAGNKSAYWEYFIVRLFECEKSTDMTDYFSAVFDEQNGRRFGAHVIEDLNKDMRLTEVIEYANAQNTLSDEKVALYKAHVLHSIEQGELSKTYDTVKNLLKIRPLDKEFLYFMLYLAIALKRKPELQRIAVVIKQFYGDDPDMQAFLKDAGYKPLSVLIPTYNRLEYLKKCIECVQRQTFTDFELIVVDNASNDGTGRYLKQLLKTEPRLKVVTNQKNMGAAYSRNVAIQTATSDYVTFVDDDDYFEPTLFEELLRLKDAHRADIAICGGYSAFPDRNEPYYVYEGEYVYNRIEGLEELLKREKYNVAPPAKLFARKLFNNAWFEPGHLVDDIHSIYKVFHYAKTIVATGKPLYYWRKHNSNMTGFIHEKKLTPALLAEYSAMWYNRLIYFRQFAPEVVRRTRYSQLSYLLSMADKIIEWNLEDCMHDYSCIMHSFKRLDERGAGFLTFEFVTEHDKELYQKVMARRNGAV